MLSEDLFAHTLCNLLVYEKYLIAVFHLWMKRKRDFYFHISQIKWFSQFMYKTYHLPASTTVTHFGFAHKSPSPLNLSRSRPELLLSTKPLAPPHHPHPAVAQRLLRKFKFFLHTFKAGQPLPTGNISHITTSSCSPRSSFFYQLIVLSTHLSTMRNATLPNSFSKNHKWWHFPKSNPVLLV